MPNEETCNSELFKVRKNVANHRQMVFLGVCPKYIEGYGVKPIDEITDNRNPIFSIGKLFHERDSMW